MIWEIVSAAGGLFTGGLIVVVVKLSFTNSRVVGDINEVYDKNIDLTKENGELKIENAQITANRDAIMETVRGLGQELKRSNIARELAEGQRDSLLEEMSKNHEKLDPQGRALAAGIQHELELLKKLSKVPPSSSGDNKG